MSDVSKSMLPSPSLSVLGDQQFQAGGYLHPSSSTTCQHSEFDSKVTNNEFPFFCSWKWRYQHRLLQFFQLPSIFIPIWRLWLWNLREPFDKINHKILLRYLKFLTNMLESNGNSCMLCLNSNQMHWNSIEFSVTCAIRFVAKHSELDKPLKKLAKLQ